MDALKEGAALFYFLDVHQDHCQTLITFVELEELPALGELGNSAWIAVQLEKFLLREIVAVGSS